MNFSETLNSSTAQNKSNYLISNGINVSSAVLSGTQVTLTTSAHSTGAYTINYDASKLNSGIYLYKIEVNDFSAIKKMMLLK